MAFNEPLTADRLKIYLMALSDLSASQLTQGLNRAVRELTFWPKPAELRELCTGVRARKSDTLRADEAWQRVMDYLDRHGIEGRTIDKCQGREDFVFRNGCINSAYSSYNRRFPENVFTISAPFYILTTYYAPDIPELISSTLTQLGGSVTAGLKRLADARKAAEPVPYGYPPNPDRNPKEIGFLKREFTESYLNAVALEAETCGPATIDPARQLAGDVPTSPDIDCLPVTLYFDGDVMKYKVLPLDEASEAHADGELDESAYAGVKSYWGRKKRLEEEQCTPTEYWACFVPHNGRDFRYSVDIPAPTAGTGVFRIESLDGKRVVYKGKLLRLEGRQVKVGDKFHVRVSPKQLETVPSINEVEVKD